MARIRGPHPHFRVPFGRSLTRTHTGCMMLQRTSCLHDVRCTCRLIRSAYVASTTVCRGCKRLSLHATTPVLHVYAFEHAIFSEIVQRGNLGLSACVAHYY